MRCQTGRGAPQPRTACCLSIQAEEEVSDCPEILEGSPLMTAVVPPHKHTQLPQTSVTHLHTGITHVPQTPVISAHTHHTHASQAPSHIYTLIHHTCTHGAHTHLHTPLRDSHLSPQKLIHVPQIKKLHSKPIFTLLQLGKLRPTPTCYLHPSLVVLKG